MLGLKRLLNLYKNKHLYICIMILEDVPIRIFRHLNAEVDSLCIMSVVVLPGATPGTDSFILP